MKKPWSITTTLRNPERLRGFLAILQQIENSLWDTDNQKKYQVLLIQNRMYGYGSSQFYQGLSQDKVNLLNDLSKEISFEDAEEIFNEKSYEDPAMRGRQSINPLKKMGFVNIKDSMVQITDFGKLFLQDDFDLGEIFLRSFLKWQIPNPDNKDYATDGSYDIKPFIGVLHLINAINKKESERGNEAKGISRREFSIFAPTLIHHEHIDEYAKAIINLRTDLHGKIKQEQGKIFEKYERKFSAEFLNTDDPAKIDGLLRNLRDYGDNALRYFRLTRYLYLRGGNFYIDLEPRRSIEIKSLLEHDNAQSKFFTSKEEYLNYISDILQPQLPWETFANLTAIVKDLVTDIHDYEDKLQKKKAEIKNYTQMEISAIRNYAAELREYRRSLQEEENSKKAQTTDQIRTCIDSLANIFDFEDRPLLLEKLSALSLHALNDALRIQPNYPVGDDNEPTFTAPANTPDIECFYKSFNAICEVTMLTRRDQWYHEGQPVMRHLRDFEQKYTSKPSYCLFIAPTLHRDTINTFWSAIKYEYEGHPQKIVPLSIKQFISILKILLQMKEENKFLEHQEILHLYDQIVESSKSFNIANEWLSNIPNVISAWKKHLIS